MDTTNRWIPDCSSLTLPYFRGLRAALRHDLERGMRLFGIHSTALAQRIEGIDRRQLKQFAAGMGSACFLTVDESSVATALSGASTESIQPGGTDGSDPWAQWLAEFTTHYLTLCRSALRDRYALAFVHFELSDHGFAQLLVRATVGELLDATQQFVRSPGIKLRSSLSLEIALEQIINGAHASDLAVCRMAHGLAAPEHRVS